MRFQNTSLNRKKLGDEHIPIVYALDAPPCYCTASAAAPVLTGLPYHFS
jgi:hypothetical protein